jgi:hypothetical protein
MLMLPTIAATLADFAYDTDIKFTSFTTPEKAPCFLCLTTIHRDARLLCVARLRQPSLSLLPGLEREMQLCKLLLTSSYLSF